MLTLSTPGAYTLKWFSEDFKGNREAVKTQRLLVAADDESGTRRRHRAGDAGAHARSARPRSAPFTPGVPKDYTAGTTANVISTAGERDAVGLRPELGPTPGHLMNGSFFLPQKLQASASSLGGTAASGGPVGGSSAPTALLNYGGPVSNDAVTLTFKQTIGATDALRTGAYSKTLTFTL